MIPKNESLNAVILPTGKLILEFQPCEETLGSDRRAIEQRIHELFASDHSRAFLALGLIDRAVRLAPSLEYWRDIAASFVHDVLVDPLTEKKRGTINSVLDDEGAAAWIGRIPPMVGAELINASFIAAIWNLLQQALKREVDGRTEPVEDILRSLSPGHGLLAHRVHFHLVENRRDEESPFAFLATYSTAIDAHGTLRHVPLGNALKEFGNDTQKLVPVLASVHKAASASSLVKSILDSGEIFHPLRFSAHEAFRFLGEVPLYESSGILCRIPRWWSTKPRRISVGLSIGDKSGGKLNAQALLTCTPLLHIDGEKISFEEAQQIFDHYDGLALIKGKWTVVDRESLRKNLELFAQARQLSGKLKIPFAEAVRLLLGMQHLSLNGDAQWAGDIICGDWLARVLDNLRSPAALEAVSLPQGFIGRLRPYQQGGLNWLAFLRELGFGACLADDMGLGKTIQVLALLQSCKERSVKEYGPSLLIVPASLIDNWLSEIRRFTPSLRAVVAHPQFTDDKTLKAVSANAGSWDLIISTYAMSRKLPWITKAHLVLSHS